MFSLAAITILVWKAGALTILHEWAIFFFSLIWLALVAACFDHFHVRITHEYKKED